MRVFRARWNSDGETRTTGRWYIEFRHGERRYRIPACTDREASVEFGRKLEHLAAYCTAKLPPGPDLCRWIESLDRPTRMRLTRIGLLDRPRSAAGKKLTEHLDDFKTALRSKGGTEKHVGMTGSMIKTILDGCGFTYWSDVDAAAIQGLLAELRKPKGKDDPGLAIQSSNHYLRAFKSFCRWMVRERRAMESPVGHLSLLNARTDRRRIRRALTPDECGKLLAATAAGETWEGMKGADRAMLYRVALETGLRWSELRSLTAGSFHFDTLPLTVTVKAAYSKHRRDDTLPMRFETVEMLADYLRGRLPTAPAFPMPKQNRGAEMLEADLKKAGIEVKNSVGVVDFHSLRHTFITNLCAAGVNPKVAQTLARHSTIGLTMDLYTHTDAASQRDAIDALPDYRESEASEARATGTDGGEILPLFLPTLPGENGSNRYQTGQSDSPDEERENAEMPANTLENDDDSGMLCAARASGGMADASDLKSDVPLGT